MTFEPTKAMIARHLKYVEESIEATIAQWCETGQLQPGQKPSGQVVEHLKKTLMVTSRPDWMQPEDALAVLISDLDAADLPDSHPQKVSLLDAMRTRSGHSEAEWVALCSSIFCLSPHSMRKYDDGGNRGTELYRCYDAHGKLLYIGISGNAAQRISEHAKHSIWHKYLDSYSVEQIPSRRDAFKVEAQAIKSERPIFNKTASNVSEDEREAYIFLH